LDSHHLQLIDIDPAELQTRVDGALAFSEFLEITIQGVAQFRDGLPGVFQRMLAVAF
jgi:hypothetical protein